MSAKTIKFLFNLNCSHWSALHPFTIFVNNRFVQHLQFLIFMFHLWIYEWTSDVMSHHRLTGRVLLLHPDTCRLFWSRTVCSLSPGPDGGFPSHSIPWWWGTEGWVLQADARSHAHSDHLNTQQSEVTCCSSPTSSWTQIPNIRRMLGDSNRLMVSTSLLKTDRTSLNRWKRWYSLVLTHTQHTRHNMII